MVVKKEVIIKRMIKELESALAESKPAKLDQRIASVKTLCELILSQEGAGQVDRGPENISPKELRAMLGEDGDRELSSFDPEEGDSIFDF